MAKKANSVMSVINDDLIDIIIYKPVNTYNYTDQVVKSVFL